MIPEITDQATEVFSAPYDSWWIYAGIWAGKMVVNHGSDEFPHLRFWGLPS